jgi:Kdo2-lipid IVA lauroyltransferase/acyltransferase
MKIIDAIVSESICLLLKGIIFTVRVTPHPIAITVGKILGLLFWLISPYYRKMVKLQMINALGPIYNRGLLFKAFMHFGMLPIEMIKFAYLDDAEIKKRLVVKGMENLESALKTGRGMMVITGHIGNWEILANIARFIGGKLHIVMDIRRDSKQEAIISDIRSRLPGVEILPPKGGVISTLIEALRQGKRIAMMVDQRHMRKYGLICDFLGMPAPSTPAPAFIALKADAIIQPVFMRREGRKRYAVFFERPIDPREFGALDDSIVRLSEGAKTQAVQNLSNHIQSLVSSVIRTTPDQWLWLHGRWLRRKTMREIIKKGLDFKAVVSEQAEEIKRGKMLLEDAKKIR